MPLEDAVRSWARWTWFIPLLAWFVSAPLVFLAGALFTGRRWLWVMSAITVDLCLVMIGAGGLPNSAGAGALGLVGVVLWFGPTIVILVTWVDQPRQTAAGQSVESSSPGWPAGDVATLTADAWSTWVGPIPSAGPSAGLSDETGDTGLETLPVGGRRSSISVAVTSWGALGLTVATWVAVLAAVTPVVPPTTVVVVHGSPADVALAKSEMLAPSQYGTGWVGLGSGTQLENDSYFATDSRSMVSQLARCLGILPRHLDPNPAEVADQAYGDEHSNFFTNHYVFQARFVNEEVDVFPTVSDAVADTEAAARRGALSCQFRFWGPSLADDVAPDLGQGERNSLPVVLERHIPTFGSHDADEEFSQAFTYDGRTSVSYNDWVTVQSGRSEANLEFQSLGVPVPVRLIDQLARAAAARLSP